MKNIIITIPAFWRGAYKADEEETQSLLWDAYGVAADALRGLASDEWLVAWDCEPEMVGHAATVVRGLEQLVGTVHAAAMCMDEVVKCLGRGEYYERATGCPMYGDELTRARRVARAYGQNLRDVLRRSGLRLRERPTGVEVVL